MRQTLFTIDHFLFANNWVLIGWLILGLAFIGFQLARGRKADAIGFVPVLLIVAAVIYWIVPNLETRGVNVADPDGPMVPDGLAVRGYGLFMLLAMVAGFGLVLYRCRQIGFDSEKILSLCFWMVVAGIVGARLFFVIQKFDSFASLSGRDLLFRMLDMTSGGLVVYGSLIGGLIAAVIYMAVRGMPWRLVGDILAPGMAIGLAIGRIGCLMNGCCYGGVCHPGDVGGISFPAASPPYVHQLAEGQLFGITGDFDEEQNRVSVNAIEPNSIADRNGIKPGDKLEIFLFHPQRDDSQARLRAAKSGIENGVRAIIAVEGRKESIAIPASRLPGQALPVVPTQIYSSINALLLCALLWFYFPWRRSEGEVLAWLLVLYPIGRFLLEMIRQDEPGQFGTLWTISQWISIGTFVVGLGLLAYVRLRRSEPRRAAAQ